jgi:hypothetical protein
VWLSALLTAIARSAIDGPTPGHAFNGKKAGTGKGRLIDAISIIAFGYTAPTTAYPVGRHGLDKEEMRKLKVTFARSAVAIVHFDNLDEGSSCGGGELDSAITSCMVNDRVLGKSESTDGIPLRPLWTASGNNISPRRDASRRWLPCNLKTSLEFPEERDDLKQPDLLAHVREHRGELVRLALLILRAHAIAGRPVDWKAPLGSFEQWDRIVRGAVWFATGWDCNATRKNAAAEAPEYLNKLALLAAWKDPPNGGPGQFGLTAAEACKLALPTERGKDKTPPESPELTEIVCRFSKDGKVNSNTIGYVIRGMRGQNLGGLAFEEAGKTHGSPR